MNPPDYIDHHEFVKFVFVQQQHGLLHKTAKEQRGGQNQQVKEKGTRNRNRQAEENTRVNLRETPKTNKSYAICSSSINT